MDEPVTRLLEEKARGVEAVTPQTSVLQAVRIMNERQIGAVLVMDGEHLAGIFTERDVLTRVLPAALDPADTAVATVMTPQPIMIPSTTTALQAMMVATDTRKRHLPVTHGGRVMGLISLGDLTRWMVRDQQRTIDELVDCVCRT